MTDMEIQDAVTRLINHNGGWCVAGSDLPRKVGEIQSAPGCPNLHINGEATEQEARADAEFLQAQFVPCPFYYKVSMD